MNPAARLKERNVYAPDANGFRRVPSSTRDLCVNVLIPSKASELESLGQRLDQLKQLTLMNGQVENLDFLRSFPGIGSFVCFTASLNNIEGLAHCVSLARLLLGTTFSSRPDLRVLGHLSRLEALRLEGPNPSKGLEKAGALPSVKVVDLYSPKFPMELVPGVFPNAGSLLISQGRYKSLSFIAGLPRLSKLGVAYARNLNEFSAIGAHPSLQCVEIQCAVSGLKSCSQFGISRSIKKLAFRSCKSLEELSPLARWPTLEQIEIESCPKVPLDEINLLKRAGKKVT